MLYTVSAGWANLVPRAARLLAAAVTLCAAIGGARLSGAEQRLLDREPFDRITLDAANKNAVLEVVPLDLPGRRAPQEPNPDDKLTIRLLDRPEKRYEVRWGAIERVELFEQMLLAEAGRLVGEGRLEEAYEYFARLQSDYPNLPELPAAMEAYLYEDAKAAFRTGDFHRALAMLWEIHQRNPQRAGLDKALGVATDQLVQQYVGEQKFPEARALTRRLERAFADHPVVAAWHQRWREQAGTLLAQVRAHLEAGRLAEASAACLRMVHIWPQLPGARELAAEVHEQYPRVVVGVARPVRVVSIDGSLRAAYTGLDDPAGRRARRLLYRTLAEMVAAGQQGGTYVCPVGQLSADASAGTLTLKINPGVGWAEGRSSLGAPDVARRIAELAQRETSSAGHAWCALLEGADVRGALEVELRLRHALPQPEALLRITVPPYAEPELARGEPPVPNGPYQIAAAETGRTVFVANPGYVLRGEAGGPKEVVEQCVPDVQAALRMLRAGELDVLERVPPRLVPRLRREADIAVGAYAVARVHCLVPDPRRALPACPTLRRAVVYGIHRSAILNRLLRGSQIKGCQVAGGPFAVGDGTNLAGAYAADPQIEPRPYDPQTARVLLRAALEEAAGAQAGEVDDAPGQCRISIAFPADEVAREACAEIQRQLGLVGIEVELRELQPGAPVDDSAADFRYVELAMEEPWADVWELVGPGGLVERSPAVLVGLQRVAEAEDWATLCRELHTLHRLFHDELSVIPLWQLTEHYAVRADLAGFAPQPITLYQQVEQWQPAFRYPHETQQEEQPAPAGRD